MMSPHKRDLKLEVQQLYQRFRLPYPKYNVQASPTEHKTYVCTVSCVDIMPDEGGMLAQQFVGKGSSKKASITAAAATAYAVISQLPLFESSKPYAESLWESTKIWLSDKGLRGDCELEGQVQMGQRHNDGWLPLQHLVHARFMGHWFRDFAPDVPRALPLRFAFMRNQLLQDAPPEGQDEALELNAVRTCIRRKELYQGRAKEDAAEAAAGSCAAAQGLWTSVQVGEGHTYSAVVVPANISQEVSEVDFEGGGAYWPTLAALLGVQPDELFFCGKVGKETHCAARPGQEGPPNPDDQLRELLIGILWPLKSARPGGAGQGQEGNGEVPAEEEAPVQPADQGNISSQQRWARLPREKVRSAAMYGSVAALQEPGPLNLRASFLAGEAVSGDVLLAYCRMRPSEWRTPVVGWGYFTIAQYWKLMAGMFPDVEYPALRGVPRAARLPHVYRTPKGWYGKPPAYLLDKFCTAGVVTSKAAYTPSTSMRPSPAAVGQPQQNGCDGTSHHAEGHTAPPANPAVPAAPAAVDGSAAVLAAPAPRPGSLTPQGPAPAHGTADAANGLQFPADQVYSCRVCVSPLVPGALAEASSEGCEDAEVAKQQAALTLLHRLQDFYQQAVRGQAAEHPGPDAEPRAPEITVIDEGDTAIDRPKDGCVVKVSYTMTSSEVPAPAQEAPDPLAGGHLLEKADVLPFEWGAGGVIPEIEALVRALGVGGRARCRARLSMDGPDILGCGWWVNATIELEYIQYRFPALYTSTQAMFTPPLSQQRHKYVEKLAQRFGSRQIVDLGCGDGKLVEMLVGDAAALPLLDYVAGVDVSQEELLRAAKRACVALNPSQQPDITAQASPAPAQAPGVVPGSCAAAALLRAGPDAGSHTAGAGQQDGAPGGAAGPASVGASGGRKPRVEMILGNVAAEASMQPEAWGELRGCDLATLVEVVEHLDPIPLSLLGGCLLGTLRPRVLLVTTPNREYNPVLHLLGRALLPIRLRNSDHRFEWTRAEFQAWAAGLAQQYGYSVEFGEIGRAMDEDEAFAAKDSPVAGGNVGLASQTAIFVRGEAELPPLEASMAGGVMTRLFDSSVDDLAAVGAMVAGRKDRLKRAAEDRLLASDAKRHHA